MVSVSYFFIMKNAKIVTKIVSSEYFKWSSVCSIEFFYYFYPNPFVSKTVLSRNTKNLREKYLLDCHFGRKDISRLAN